MRYCQNCGTQVSDSTTYCPRCGISLVNTAPSRSNYQSYIPPQQLRTNRSLLKCILLSLITFGIYGLVVMSHISEEINTVAERYDGKHTMHYLLVFLVFGVLTLGIAPIVWTHRICNRMGNELSRRGIDYSFGAGTFWGWNVLGSLIIIGPFIYGHKFYKSMNLINENYNRAG